MSNEEKISRRAALKVIAVGVGTVSTLPILENDVLGQHQHPDMQMGRSPGASLPVTEGARFFNPQEMETIAAISDLIIPTDQHSPGSAIQGQCNFERVRRLYAPRAHGLTQAQPVFLFGLRMGHILYLRLDSGLVRRRSQEHKCPV